MIFSCLFFFQFLIPVCYFSAVLVKILGRVNGSYVNEQKHSNVSAEVVRVFNQGIYCRLS